MCRIKQLGSGGKCLSHVPERGFINCHGVISWFTSLHNEILFSFTQYELLAAIILWIYSRERYFDTSHFPVVRLII